MPVTLYRPEIAGNVGNVLRSCACFGHALHIVEPTGFPLAARDLRRAAMDYGAKAEVHRHATWEAYAEAATGRRVLFTVRADTTLDAARLCPDDHLVFGRESAGVPDAVHVAADLRVRVPIVAGARSLNLANTVAIALFEQFRQGRA